MEIYSEFLSLFIVMLAIALLTAFMGYKIYNGGWGHLVQLGGYNVDPVSASKNYDVDSLFRRTGRICFVVSACLIIMAVCSVTGYGLLGVTIFLSAITISIVAELYCMNKYDRVRP